MASIQYRRACMYWPEHDWTRNSPPLAASPSSFHSFGILGPAIAMALLFNVIEARGRAQAISLGCLPARGLLRSFPSPFFFRLTVHPSLMPHRRQYWPLRSTAAISQGVLEPCRTYRPSLSRGNRRGLEVGMANGFLLYGTFAPHRSLRLTDTPAPLPSAHTSGWSRILTICCPIYGTAGTGSQMSSPPTPHRQPTCRPVHQSRLGPNSASGFWPRRFAAGARLRPGSLAAA